MKLKIMKINVRNLYVFSDKENNKNYTPPVLEDYDFIFEEEERKRIESYNRRRRQKYIIEENDTPLL
jgi:hypothetical protein